MTRPFTIIMTLLLAALLTHPAIARDVAIRAGVESERVFIGEPFLYQIIVDGDEQPGPVTFPEVDGLTIEELPPEQSSGFSVTIINGRRTQTERLTTVLRWRLTAEREGTIEIPGVGVDVTGKIYVTDGAVVQVVPPVETDDIKLRIATGRTNPFVGESVRVRFTLYVNREARELRFMIPEHDGALEFVPAPPPNVSQTDLRAGRAIQVNVNGRPSVGLVGEGALDDKQFVTLTFDVLMTARRAGPHELGPAIASMDIVTGRRRTSDFMLMSTPVTERLVTPSNTIAIAARPLPAEGRPPNFSGPVGVYSVNVGATPTTVNVGDPITLTIAVRGPEPIEDAPLPDLALQPDVTEQFKLTEGGSPPRIEGGAKTIERTVRARTPDVERIPHIGFWTFDPQAEKYVRAESRPIPLSVGASAQFTLADAPGLDEPESAPLESREAGLAANRVGPRLLAAQGFDLGAELRRPAAIMALGAPALLGLSAVAVTLVRRRDASDLDARAAKSALRRALADLEAVTDPGHTAAAEEVSRIVRRYIGERCRRAAAGLTTSDAAGLARAAGSPDAEALSDLLHRCDLARFGGDASVAVRLRDEAASLIRRMDPALGRFAQGRAA